tara:strand:+ start:725 stop:874 length:150 start_codon:yes stop_codon:yes gene_type:complete
MKKCYKLLQKRYKRERQYHIDLEKKIKQNVIKKTNANADWLKKHLIILT